GPVMRQISEGPVQAFPGPDFVTGWGLVRAAEAVELVARRALADGTISASCDSVPFDFEVAAGSRVLRVTLAWDDVAADAGGNRLGPRLVNDLDLVLVDPSGVPHRPWLLDQVVVDASGVPVPDSAQRCGRRPTVRRSAIPVAADVPQPDPLQGAMLAAVRGRDHLNNVEQVLVDNPTPGRWRMWVVGFDVRWGPQPFAVAGPTIMP
ncbi:MAG TPA: hypothetical protein VFT45_11940, partial [Longimicrobium sp.]|nr:hypothetical protein [Longimicrobium sp.]